MGELWKDKVGVRGGREEKREGCGGEERGRSRNKWY